MAINRYWETGHAQLEARAFHLELVENKATTLPSNAWLVWPIAHFGSPRRIERVESAAVNPRYQRS
jgi:hypothetical protein